MTEEEFWDQLWNESPRVQKMKVQYKEQGRKEAQLELAQLQKQLVEGLRRALVSMVHVRFPDLSEFAQQRVELFDKPDVLDLLIQQMAKAPDANIARLLLDPNTETPG